MWRLRIIVTVNARMPAKRANNAMVYELKRSKTLLKLEQAKKHHPY